MIRVLRSDLRVEYFALALLCAISGLTLSRWPGTTFALLGAGLALAWISRVPRPFIALFVLFLVAQDPLRLVLHGDETISGFVLKRMDEAVLFVLAGWALLVSPATHAALRWRGMRIAIAACLAALVVSSLMARVQLFPALMDLVLASKPFAFFIVGSSLALSPSEIKRSVNPLLYIAMAVILFAVVFLAFPNLQDAYIGDVRGADQRVGVLSAQGFFDGPGQYSWFCAAIFSFAYAAYLSFERTAYLVAAGLAGLFTLLAWRRKSIGAVILILLVATVLRGDGFKNRLRTVGIVGLVAVLAATLFAPYIVGLMDYTVQEYGPDPYSTARVALSYTSILIARDHFPLGTGLASFASHASRVYYSDVYHEYGLATVWGLSPAYPEYITDTFWPMVLGEGGVLALACYLWFFGLILWVLWGAARRDGLSPEDRFVAFSSLFVFLGSLAESTSSPIYHTSLAASLALIPAGICWGRFAAPPSADRP